MDRPAAGDQAAAAPARRWPLYLIEAWGLGTFMVAAAEPAVQSQPCIHGCAR
jgi:hypothetical protein